MDKHKATINLTIENWIWLRDLKHCTMSRRVNQLVAIARANDINFIEREKRTRERLKQEAEEKRRAIELGQKIDIESALKGRWGFGR